jgi:hypothetical protein
MAEHNIGSDFALSDCDSRQDQHHITASASATFEVHNPTELNGSDFGTIQTSMHVSRATQTSPAPFRQHYPSKSTSSFVSPNTSDYIQRRGRDWESFSMHPQGKVSSTYLETIRQNSGVAYDHDGMQQNPLSAIKQSGARQKPIALYSRNDLPIHPVQSLGLSSIKPWFVSSPVNAPQSSRPHSPGSFGPHSENNSPMIAVVSPQPSSPDVNGLPKYTSAFEYAMRLFLETPMGSDMVRKLCWPPPAQEDADSVATSPLLPPPQDDQISYTSVEEDEDIAEYGIPAHLREKDSFRTTMRLDMLRRLLGQCAIVLATVQEVERKPWVAGRKRPPGWYYSRISSLAYHARRLAQLLESRDLQARCEYWAGRGCGGIRDYQAAEEHFKMAIQLDVQNDLHKSGKIRLRGLRPVEKADVRFLFDSASARHEDWKKRYDGYREHAQHLLKQSKQLAQDYMDSVALYSPPWMPDRDRVVQLAREELGIRERTSHRTGDVVGIKHEQTIEDKQGLEDQVEAQWENEDRYVREMVRRRLNKKEWEYIHHDVVAGKAKATQRFTNQILDKHGLVPRRKSTLENSTSASSSYRYSSMGRSPPPLRNLDLELAGANWQGGTSSSHSYLSPSQSELPENVSAQASPLELQSPKLDLPLIEEGTSLLQTTSTRIPSEPGSLQQRRNVKLKPLETETVKTEADVQNEMRGLSTP